MTAVSYFKPFDDCAPYTQEDAEGLSFRTVLPENTFADISIGLVTAQGPTHKLPGTHTQWDQAYVIFRGTGKIHLDGKTFPIDKPGVAVIPHGTEHSIEADAGQTLQYVYINRYLR